MANEEAKKKMKPRVPTAAKRMKQNKAKQERNKTFKSRVRTAINAFKKATSDGDKEGAETGLNLVYQLMDKGVNRGIFKRNKSSRIKSRMKAQSL